MVETHARKIQHFGMPERRHLTIYLSASTLCLDYVAFPGASSFNAFSSEAEQNSLTINEPGRSRSSGPGLSGYRDRGQGEQVRHPRRRLPFWILAIKRRILPGTTLFISHGGADRQAPNGAALYATQQSGNPLSPSANFTQTTSQRICVQEPDCDSAWSKENGGLYNAKRCLIQVLIRMPLSKRQSPVTTLTRPLCVGIIGSRDLRARRSAAA